MLKSVKQLFAVVVVAIALTSFRPKEIVWVAIGDSITYLNDHTDETSRRVSKGYLTMVTEQLHGVHYINQGHNGWTSGDIAGQIAKLGLVKADVYSIFLGTNDWWHGRPVGTLADYTNNTGDASLFGSFRIIIDKLHTLNPSAKIILVTPMQRADFVYINDSHNNAYGSYREKNGQSLEQFASAIQEIGKQERCDVIDLYHAKGMAIRNLVHFKRLKDPHTGEYNNYAYPKFVDQPFNPDTDEYPYPPQAADVTYDGLHPSDKGNSLIAKKIARVIKKYLR